MLTDKNLGDMYERAARGEQLGADESLELVLKVRHLQYDLLSMDNLYNTLSLQYAAHRAEDSKTYGRIRYVLRQLEKEAKFKRREVPEDSRFYRAYDTLAEVVGH